MSHSAFSPGDVVRVGDCIGVLRRGPRLDAPSGFVELADGLLGGAALYESLRPVRLAANSRLPVLILGETGTGKECLARAIHQWSGRIGPFRAINCAALPENLAEAELFGYRKGAFTGSDRASPGIFRAAQHGTLLLDEVGDLPLSIQAKLLRSLEQHEVLPLGETRPVPIDVRVISAGHDDLNGKVVTGAIRQDLFARLSGLTVELPPLRTRREDVIPLFTHYLSRISKGAVPSMKATFAEALCLHDWPCNVRELRLLAEYMFAVHGQTSALKADLLPNSFGRRAEREATPQHSPRFASRATEDLRRLAIALEKTSGNLKAAAEHVGISRARAYRLLSGKRPAEVMASLQRALRESSIGGAPGHPSRCPDDPKS